MHSDFQNCPSEQTLFIKRSSARNILIFSIYVDDLIYTLNDTSMIIKFKKSMMQAYDLTNLGKMRFFLSFEIL